MRNTQTEKVDQDAEGGKEKFPAVTAGIFLCSAMLLEMRRGYVREDEAVCFSSHVRIRRCISSGFRSK